MSRLDEIKARAEQVHWTSTSIEQAMARMASSAADVPWLVSEVERLTRVIDAKPRQPLVVLNEYLDRTERAEAEVTRLTAERDALAQIKRHIDEVRNGTGWTVQIYGVLLQQCDQYGKTIDTRRAERAEAERDALAAQVARVESLAGQWERLAATAINPDSREWLQACAETLRECLSGWQKMSAALAGSEADTSGRETGHKCEPYYSRSECGQCGWQEQWCVTCSRQMCGCATGATDQDAMGADQ